uniref:Integrase catalytic domain-containing protein n=1 Tax=Trichogramma kaykai TaxID=54128 RepID=A0ABD2WRQ5_9HYME
MEKEARYQSVANHRASRRTRGAVARIPRSRNSRTPGSERNAASTPEDTRDYVRNCTTCKEIKKNRTLPYAQRVHKPSKPWDTVALDLMGPYPATNDGSRHLLVVTDMFSRWVEVFPIVATDATTIAARVEKDVFARWGFPRAVLTDNGTQCTSKAWAIACKTWQAIPWTTANYWPQANPTERRNQEIKTALRTQLRGWPHNEWDEHLPKILFQLRNRRNAATGKTPAEILLGRELLLPGEWKFPHPFTAEKEAELEAVRRHRAKYQATYIKDGEQTESHFKIGEMVYIRASPFSKASKNYCAGFASPWEGPFPIVRIKKSGIYVVGKGKSVTTHVSRIKPVEKGR